MTLPLNRFVAFIKPWINVLAAAAAAWLIAKANVLGIPGLDEANTATWIAGALTWLLTQGALQLGDLKWLKGHHVQILAQAQVDAAAATQTAPTAVVVSDDEEFANPPSVPESAETPDPPE